MDFDERLIRREHVLRAIDHYLSHPDNHSSARSAFLIYKNSKLPAKHIIKMAFYEATGCEVAAETLTGGKASIRVLQNLGFETSYEKSVGGNRNPIKSLRREALRQILSEKWGPVATEVSFPQITVPDFRTLQAYDSKLYAILQAIEQHRGIQVEGRINHKLAFDFYIPKLKLCIEFDERQHFTPLRASALRAYPQNVLLGFDAQRWISLSESIRAGDNSPIYRDEQRAFYDSIRDIWAPKHGLRPVVRLFEEDVLWEKETALNSTAARTVLRLIQEIGQVSAI